MAKIRARKSGVEKNSGWLAFPVIARIGISAIIGLAIGIPVGIHFSILYGLLAFWCGTGIISAAALWLSVRTLDASTTCKHATKDDPSRSIVDVFILCASVASLAAVVILIVHAGSDTGILEILDIVLGILTIMTSWVLTHLIYMLRYADMYYSENGGVDFNSKEDPTYQDFAYLAFTIGMTYQVADTNITSPVIRRTIRQHAMLSFIFGTAIIATVINTVAGLGK